MDTRELVNVAYKKFKQYVYYEQLDLFQRKRLADFEASPVFELKLEKFGDLINSIKMGTNHDDEIDELLKKIGYHLLPKNILKVNEHEKTEEEKKKDEHFITNNNVSDEYQLIGVNYFIDAPIEIYLLCVIWVMKVGILIDSELENSCYWFRLNEKMQRPDDRSSHIFKMYHTQYSDWRNKALDIAERALKEDKVDIAILSLDLRHCYYCINSDFDSLIKFFESKISDKDDRLFALELTNILKKIHQTYRDKIDPHFCYSHDSISEKDDHYPLPIGLASSGLLCNWHLKEFDVQIKKDLNPAYYGRYIDDILIVITNPQIEPKDTVREFMKRYFETTQIFEYDEKSETYRLKHLPDLSVQRKKLFLHHYSAGQSSAILDIFKQKVLENSSAFYLLPVEDLEFHINETAYNLLFSGSTNKFRNITGLVENVTELSKNLTKIISTLNQSKAKDEDIVTISDQLLKFYKGKNFINFCRTWEKLFTFTIITGQYDKAANFYIDIQGVIKQITKFTPETGKKLGVKESSELLEAQKSHLQDYLDISVSLPVGLLGSTKKIYLAKHRENSINRFKDTNSISQETTNIQEISQKIRDSNLVRHNYIVFPLLNYTNYDGSLIDWDQIEEEFSKSQSKLDENKIKFSPRFIHFDEFYLYRFSQKLKDISKLRCDEILKDYIDKSPISKELLPIEISYKEYYLNSDSQEGSISGYQFCIPKLISTDKNLANDVKLKIGVANIKVAMEDLDASYKPGKKPNLSFERQKELFKLLNFAKKEKCSLFVLPELSIPYRWLPFMLKYSRNHQMGLVFGMEYWVVDNNNPIAYNFIVTALPIKNEDKYKTCCVSIRCKNHYSPLEKVELERAFLKIPNIVPFSYDLFKWRGTQFSVYNCYELADIKHRSIFRSELDFLVACVLNRDLNYFSSIIESAVKDLHCYVIQVNCSEYGDSRIIQPTRKEQMDILRVTGGSNSTVLTVDLEIKKLREFQSLGHSEKDKSFKPTPPGFNNEKVKARGICEKLD